jgi:uncharacterized protein YegL
MDHSIVGLLPVYLVIDVSWSMSVEGKLAATNRMIGTVTEVLARDPELAQRVHLGIIDFSDDAQVRMPLREVTRDVNAPQLNVRNGTSYSSAFTVVRHQIAADTARRRMLAPTVFFMSDGGPTDDELAWRTAFQTLITHSSRPVVVPFGLDDAEAHIMGSLIHPLYGPDRAALFMMAPGARAAAAVTGVGEIVVSSLLRSGDTGGRIVLPDRRGLPPGVLRYEPEQFA